MHPFISRAPHPNIISRPHQPIRQPQRRRSTVGLSIGPLHDHRLRSLIEDEWLALCTPIYARAVNIQDLVIKGNIVWSSNNRWELFKSVVSDMKLRRLALSSASDGPLDFTPVLRGQPELRRLELDCSTAHFEGLGEADVSELQSFKGTPPQAAMIVPGRPVRQLHLHSVSRDA